MRVGVGVVRHVDTISDGSVSIEIMGQGPGLVNVLLQREWLRVDQFWGVKER